MKKIILLLLITFIALWNVTPSYAAWLIYGKPEFKGRVIDAETKQPIEGAVVVTLYYKWPMISGAGGPNAYVFHAKETLTNRNGEFYMPSFSSLSLSILDAGIRFIFYKPGYLSIEGAGPKNAGISDAGISFEKYFSTGKIGEVLEIEEGSLKNNSYVKWKGPVGIVELKRVPPENAMPPRGIPANYGVNELPLLYKAINLDRKCRGLKGEAE